MRRDDSVLELIRAFNEYTLTDEFKFEFLVYSELTDEQYDVRGCYAGTMCDTNKLAIIMLLEDHIDKEKFEEAISLLKFPIRKFKCFIYVPDDQNPGSFELTVQDGNVFSGFKLINGGIKLGGDKFLPLYDINVLHDGDLNIEWKDYDSKYEISNIGEKKKKKTKRLLMPQVSKSGGFIYSIHNKPSTASKMVLEAFYGPAGRDDLVAVHINGNSYDNRICNLKWGSFAQKISEDTITKMSRARKYLYTYGPEAKNNREKLSKAAKKRCAAGNSNSIKWKSYCIEVNHDCGAVETFKTAKEYARKYGFNPSRVYPYIKSGKHFDAGNCFISRVDAKNKGE